MTMPGTSSQVEEETLRGLAELDVNVGVAITSSGDGAADVNQVIPSRVMHNRISMAERYRLAMVVAVGDSGRRALCVAGRGCTCEHVCGFCPDGVLRPRPADGYEQYHPAIAQARSLWNVAFGPSADLLKVCNCVGEASLGGMLLAAHVQGHNCISTAFDGVFAVRVPHAVKSLKGVQSWAKQAKQKLLLDVDDRLLAVVRAITRFVRSDGSIATAEVTHCFQVPAEGWKSFAEVSLPSFTAANTVYSLSAQVFTFKKALKMPTDVVVDVGYESPVPCECISALCATMPADCVYCNRCHCTVKRLNHHERCRTGEVDEALELILRRAQIGDAAHQMDVLLVLMGKGVPSSERTIRLVEYKQRTVQAQFMRLLGHSGPTAVLSTWFEAGYDYFRPVYLELTFGCPRVVCSISNISSMIPELDPGRISGVPAPDYWDAWSHLRKIHNLQIPVDFMLARSFRELRAPDSPEYLTYMSNFTQLPEQLGSYFNPGDEE